MAETPNGSHVVLVSTVDQSVHQGHAHMEGEMPASRRLRVFSVGEAVTELRDANVEIPREFEPWYAVTGTRSGVGIAWIEQHGGKRHVMFRSVETGG